LLTKAEGWQNGYCTSLENWRPKGLGGSNPSPSASKIIKSISLEEPYASAPESARDGLIVLETLEASSAID
jgi:hypothetical protein